MGSLLLIIGLGGPLHYFITYNISVRNEAKNQKLDTSPLVYTLHFTSQGVGVSDKKETATYQWKDIFRAYKRKKAIYIYIVPKQAFLIPLHCLKNDPDSFWQDIKSHLGEEKTFS